MLQGSLRYISTAYTFSNSMALNFVKTEETIFVSLSL